MLRVKRKLSAGALAAATYDNAKYKAVTNDVADGMGDVMRANVGVGEGELRDGVFVDKGTENEPTIVGASGEHSSTEGRPIAETLSVAFLNNYGTSDTAATHFMEAAALYAESQGMKR